MFKIRYDYRRWKNKGQPVEYPSNKFVFVLAIPFSVLVILLAINWPQLGLFRDVKCISIYVRFQVRRCQKLCVNPDSMTAIWKISCWNQNGSWKSSEIHPVQIIKLGTLRWLPRKSDVMVPLLTCQIFLCKLIFKIPSKRRQRVFEIPVVNEW